MNLVHSEVRPPTCPARKSAGSVVAAVWACSPPRREKVRVVQVSQRGRGGGRSRTVGEGRAIGFYTVRRLAYKGKAAKICGGDSCERWSPPERVECASRRASCEPVCGAPFEGQSTAWNVLVAMVGSECELKWACSRGVRE
ncbi:hypothetical protein NDU88_006225 [Pleurodeles waltl]|uniref:Uncharacterized protein n=1 Tax=Pleurodeles waltl TaxID=8319 RepID=A0AAV7SNZ1_PLEWA|nr:hypothetical protein NDU88_006225 [Pleurodeles waltl]